MGLADDGIAGDPAQELGDAAGGLALAPEPAQLIDPVVCPFHGVTYDI
jgi:hypothetical protein